MLICCGPQCAHVLKTCEQSLFNRFGKRFHDSMEHRMHIHLYLNLNLMTFSSAAVSSQ